MFWQEPLSCARCIFCDIQETFSLCRYDSPSIGEDDGYAIWPAVRSEDWCRHYMERQAADTDTEGTNA